MYKKPRVNKEIHISFINTATARQTIIKTGNALALEMLNLMFLIEKVGTREIIDNATIETQPISQFVCSGIENSMSNLSKMNCKPIGISTNPAPAGAGTPVK